MVLIDRSKDDHIAAGQQVFDTANNMISARSDPNAAMQQLQSSRMYQNISTISLLDSHYLISIDDRVQEVETFFNNPNATWQLRTDGSEEGNDSQQDGIQSDSPRSSQTSLHKDHTSRRRGFVHQPEAYNGGLSVYPYGTGTHSKEPSKTSLLGQIGTCLSPLQVSISFD